MIYIYISYNHKKGERKVDRPESQWARNRGFWSSATWGRRQCRWKLTKRLGVEQFWVERQVVWETILTIFTYIIYKYLVMKGYHLTWFKMNMFGITHDKQLIASGVGFYRSCRTSPDPAKQTLEKRTLGVVASTSSDVLPKAKLAGCNVRV